MNQIVKQNAMFLPLMISALLATGVALPLQAKEAVESEKQIDVTVENTAATFGDIGEDSAAPVSYFEIFGAIAVVGIGVFGGIGGKVRNMKK